MNRKRVQPLMRVMALEAIDQKPNTNQKHPDHKVYVYLLRDLTIDRPNPCLPPRRRRSLKYEEVFIKAYGSAREARLDIGGWLAFYNAGTTVNKDVLTDVPE